MLSRVELLLRYCIIIICHYVFVQTHRMCDTNMNYELWVILMCHKCTTL